MSEHNDLDVLELIHRAAEDAPPMQVSAAAVVRGGRRRVGQRRSLFGGLALAAAAAAGAVAIVLSGDGSLLSQEPPPPAEQDRVDPTPVVSDDWDAELTFEDGTTYTLRADGGGAVLQSGDMTSPLSERHLAGPEVTRTDESGHTVLLVPGWDATDPSAVRVASSHQADLSWLAPFDTARIELADGRPLIAMVMPVDASELHYIPAEVRPDGSLVLARPGPAGIRLRLEGEQVIPMLDYEPLARVEGREVPGAVAYDAGDLGVVVLFEGSMSWQAAAIVQDVGAGPVVRDDLPRDLMPVTASLLAGLLPPDTDVLGFALRSAAAAESGAVNEWSLAGSATHGNVALDGGVVASAEGVDLWLLAPADADVPVAGAVDEDVIAVRTGPTSALLVTVHRDPTTAQFVLRAGAGLSGGGAATSEELAGSRVTFANVTLHEGSTVRDSIRGVDTDGDGEADLPLTQVVDLTGAPLDEG